MKNKLHNRIVNTLEWIREADVANDKVEITYATSGMVLLSKYSKKKKWTLFLQVTVEDLQHYLDNDLINVYCTKRRQRYYATLRKV